MSYFLLVPPQTQDDQPPETIQLVLPPNLMVAAVVQQQPDGNNVLGFLINPVAEEPNQHPEETEEPEIIYEQSNNQEETPSTANAIEEITIDDEDSSTSENPNVGVAIQNVKPWRPPPPQTTNPGEYKEFLKASREQLIKGEITINVYCWRLVRYRLQNGQAKCSLCGALIAAVHRRERTQKTQRLNDHARKHLNKPTVTCRLCDATSVTFAGAQHHLKFKHNLTATRSNLHEFSQSIIDELAEMIDQCFKEGEEVKFADDEMTVDEYCHRALRNRTKNGCLRCSICQHKIRVGNLMKLTHVAAIDHVLSHLDKDLFACRLCDGFRSKLLMNIKSHLRNAHRELMNSENVDDKTMEHIREIKTLIDHCYGRPDGSEGSSFQLPQEMLGRFQRTKTRIVYDRCRDLIRKYSEAGRVNCLRCSKSLQCLSSAKVVINRFMLDHAAEHLGKPLYQCRYCHTWKTGLQPICMHVLNSHGKSSKDGYVDISHEHTDEILRMLTKCYDKERQDNATIFGLEESDDDSISILDSRNRKSASHGYSLRTRSQVKKQRFEESSDDEPSVGDRYSEKNQGFRFGQLLHCKKMQVQIKTVWQNGIFYRCDQCSFGSRYEILVKNHASLMHR